MKFLDQKEQVIDLQLTQHGKRLLSQGIFKPVYYTFADSDILYDSDYASASYGENQSAIEPRIQEETPRLSVQANYNSAEALVPNRAGLLGQRIPKNSYVLKEDPDKYDVLEFSLGTSSPLNEKLPAWNVAFLNGELSGSNYFYTDKRGKIHFIPQLDAKVTYNIEVKTQPTTATPDEQEATEALEAEFRVVHGDGTYVSVKDDFLLLRVAEDNVPFSKENYDIEVYEVLREGEELSPLAISPTAEQNDFFVLNEASSNSEAEYYVELPVDDEIDPSLLADLVTQKVGSLYLDKGLRRSNTRTQAVTTRRDIYKSVVDPTEHCEE